MHVFHLLADSGLKENLGVISQSFDLGDVLVVSPGQDILSSFDNILDRQLNQKRESKKEMEELRMCFKKLCADEEFQTEVDSTLDRVNNTLHQAMSLTFRDNSLIYYVKAYIVNLCARCAGFFIKDSEVVDGRMSILCESNNGIPVVDWKLTQEAVLSLPRQKRLIVGGAYGRKVSGETVDLGKRGSELTANIIGAVFNAASVRFYVAGFTYSESASLTYEEAAQRFSGGEPVYPPSMLPAKKAGLKLEVADTQSGKTILTIASVPDEQISKGITGVVVSDPMSLFTVYGTGLLGSIGISSAIFGILAKNGINIHFISQSLSEYSISFAVKRTREAAATKAIHSLIDDTCQANFNDLSFSTVPVEIVSVFGQGMRNVPGISGKVYSALGNAGVNVIASSQGGEELSISIVVAEADAPKAAEALFKIK
jgi:Aspartokinases